MFFGDYQSIMIIYDQLIIKLLLNFLLKKFTSIQKTLDPAANYTVNILFDLRKIVS